jgi:SAM-dependent methyltransferase
MIETTPTARACVVCRLVSSGLDRQERLVRSNIRAYREQAFAVWRCPRCRSLHARDPVNLSDYYAAYPFFALRVDLRLRLLYDNQLRRLQRAGLTRSSSILDYGTGAGHFVQHLRARGYHRAEGYDEYSPAFRDPAVLEQRYDCVTSQDVLEHVPDPCVLLDRFDQLVVPGGLLAIGTPNADAIDLEDPERHVHALHMPYHRHILSKQALFRAGQSRGWSLQRHYSTQYANTAFPCLNSRFYLHYMRCLDNTLDALLGPPQLVPLLYRLPSTLFWAFWGSLFAEETDIMAIFRTSLPPVAELRTEQRSCNLFAGACH